MSEGVKTMHVHIGNEARCMIAQGDTTTYTNRRVGWISVRFDLVVKVFSLDAATDPIGLSQFTTASASSSHLLKLLYRDNQNIKGKLVDISDADAEEWKARLAKNQTPIFIVAVHVLGRGLVHLALLHSNARDCVFLV